MKSFISILIDFEVHALILSVTYSTLIGNLGLISIRKRTKVGAILPFVTPVACDVLLSRFENKPQSLLVKFMFSRHV